MDRRARVRPFAFLLLAASIPASMTCGCGGGGSSDAPGDSGTTDAPEKDAGHDAPAPCLPGVGDGAELSFVPGDLGFALAASDADAIYVQRYPWGGRTELVRVEKSDATTTLLASTYDGSAAFDMLLDGDHVFLVGVDPGALISRVGTHGEDPRVIVSSYAGIGGAPSGMARLGDRLYFASGSTLFYVSVDGGDVQTLAHAELRALTTDGIALYGVVPDASSVDGLVVRIPPLTAAVRTLATVPNEIPMLIAADYDAVYLWTWGHAAGTVPEGPASILRVDTHGSLPMQLASPRYQGIRKAQLDCSGLFYWGYDGGLDVAPALHRISKTGGDVETIVTGATDFTVDATSVAWKTGETTAARLHLAPRL